MTKRPGEKLGCVYAGSTERIADDYMVKGKQYIVVAVSGGPYSGEYIAYTLPSAGE